MSRHRPHEIGGPATPIVVGHRGAPQLAPENTLASFEAALAVGADAIELDARATADGELVVFHDVLLDRLTDASGPLAQVRLAELRRVRLRGGAAIPSLVEALAFLRGRCETFVDLKPAPHVGLAELVDAVLRALAAGAKVSEVVLVAEEEPSLRAAQARAPSLRIVPHLPPGGGTPPGAWAASVQDRTAPAEDVVALARPGRALVWTVNDATRLRALADAGADAIVTDRPELLRATLAVRHLAA